ncbi:MAG: hypothetical protein JRN20_20810, partial [Nitrososphaerota archaeon]|nr:hypothetical protein [Nitrososphaerota archaeon]
MTLENEDLVPFAVDLARRSGCEYSEARIHKSSDVTCFTRNGEAEPAMISECVGIGIRILRDGALAFGATNMLSQESVRSLVAQLVKEASVATNATRKKIVFSAEKAHVKKWSSEETKRVEDVSIESMVSYLREIDLLLSAPIRDVTFPNRNLFLGY